MTEPLLTLDNLVIGYHEPLTEPISLEVGRGEVVAILGPSGVGKTTLLRTIAGLVMPLGGSSHQRVDKQGGLGYIPQNLGLARHGTVAHNVSARCRRSNEMVTFHVRSTTTKDDGGA